MTAQLEVRQILNANPAWARTNLGPLDKLTVSIERHGIKNPILVKPDFLVIDGARRVVVASNLGMETVPIIVCHSWEEVRKYFNPIAPDCHPMDWPDLIDLWYEILNPIHSVVQRSQALVTRRSGIVKEKRDSYSGFVAELAEIYNVAPSTIKTIRDYVRRVERKRLEYPIFTGEVTKWYPTGEAARDLTLIRGLKMVMENICLGIMTEEEALDVFQRRMNGEQIPHSRRAKPRKAVSTTPRNFTTITTFAEMLENLATEADGFHVFMVSANEANEIVTRLSRSLTEIGRMKRRLALAAGTPLENKEKV